MMLEHTERKRKTNLAMLLLTLAPPEPSFTKDALCLKPNSSKRGEKRSKQV